MADNWLNNLQNQALNNSAFINYLNFMNTNPVARQASRAAGMFGGYDTLEGLRDLGKGNYAGAAFNAGEAALMKGWGKGILSGLKSSVTSKSIVPAATSLFGYAKNRPKTWTATKGLVTSMQYPELFTGYQGNIPASATNKPVQTTPVSTTPTAPDFNKMTQAEKLDWIAKNDIMSPNFQQAYAQESPQYALALKLMNTVDPEAERDYRETTTAANEEWNMAQAGIKAQRKAGQKQYVRGKEGINAETSGANLDLRAALAGTGGLMSPGLYGVGQESNISQGQKALADLAAGKAIVDQNLIAMQGQADLRRKQALMNAQRNRTAATQAYWQKLIRMAQGEK